MIIAAVVQVLECLLDRVHLAAGAHILQHRIVAGVVVREVALDGERDERHVQQDEGEGDQDEHDLDRWEIENNVNIMLR